MSKPSRKSKRQPRLGICVYCGISGEVTRDHVIPRGMFHHRANSTFTVDACRACNVDKSRYDPELRDFAISNMNSGQHPYHDEILHRMFRAVSRNQSRIGRRIKWLARPRTFVHNGEIIDGVSVPIDGEDQRKAVAYIAKAVWYRHFDEVATDGMLESRYFDMFAIKPEVMMLEITESQPPIQLLDKEGVALICGWPFVVGDRGRKVLFITMRFYGGPAYSVVMDNRRSEPLEDEVPIAKIVASGDRADD